MGRKDGDAVYLNLEKGLYVNLPQLRAVTLAAEEEFVSLLVKRRGASDWLVVCKRFAGDGGLEVVFGSGFDLVGALLGLEGSLAANRWRPETPWKP